MTDTQDVSWPIRYARGSEYTFPWGEMPWLESSGERGTVVEVSRQHKRVDGRALKDNDALGPRVTDLKWIRRTVLAVVRRSGGPHLCLCVHSPCRPTKSGLILLAD